MKRLHIHLAVENLADSIRFYSTLFAVPPTVTKSDYAKWMLDDPRVNFAISNRGSAVGVNHLGVQVEDPNELAEMHMRLQDLQCAITPEPGAACCYASSDKYWATDPQGIAWETFHTLGSIPVFGEAVSEGSACCVPPAANNDNDHPSCCAPENSAASAKCC
jgi:catechol 2,3-dioxygenase-like lactoylglutathione lyase family enzyme